MKKCLLLFCVLISGVLAARNSKPINSIIGDESYIMKYGHAPNDQTNDHDRIQTHLAYAEFLLRNANVSDLSSEERATRNHTLDLLHDYWVRGIFPQNADYATERQPCFIDDNGTICAVGYLVEQTAGRDVAELISERHLYQTILEMKDPILDEWVKSTGLTLEECAIIQPTYEWTNQVDWYLSYGVSYRVTDNFYHSVELYRRESHSHNMRFTQYGGRFDWLRHGDFSAGLKFAAPTRIFARHANALVSFEADAFCYDATWGINLRPGLEWRKEWNSGIGFGIGYSYSIPIIEEDKYGAGRHDFTARISMNLGKIRLPDLRNHQKGKDSGAGSSGTKL